MTNDFDYIEHVSEEAYLEPDVDDGDVIDECDLALCEFDQYVQEGVGTKVLIGVGIVAALGGLIALIVYICKKNGNKGVKKQAEKTKEDAKQVIEEQGADTPVPGAAEAVAQYEKKQSKLRTALKKLASKFRRNKNVGESFIDDTYEGFFYQESAHGPIIDKLGSYLTETMRLSGEIIKILEDMVSAVIDASDASDVSTDAMKKAMRPHVIKLDNLSSRVDEIERKLGNIGTGNLDDNDITVQEIYDLSDVMSRAFDIMADHTRGLENIRRKVRNVQKTRPSTYRFLENMVSPLITEFSAYLGAEAESAVFCLADADQYLKKLISTGELGATKTSALRDLSDTMSTGIKNNPVSW